VVIGGKILKMHGWKEGRSVGLAKSAARLLQNQGMEQESVLARLDLVRSSPADYLDDTVTGTLASEVLRTQQETARRAEIPVLRSEPLAYRVWGVEGIDVAARTQMDAAMRLPITVSGALMPDAHVGYGLPIGGVLATQDAVIPYAVGVDIACRMRLSVYPVGPDVLDASPRPYIRALQDHTYFGAGVAHPRRPEHRVLDDSAWNATRLLKGLQGIAAKQLGTSGTGNHFVEWGAISITEQDSLLGLPTGKYLALLSHSGSRGVGFKIANAYSKLAMDLHPQLDRSVRHLAWLTLDSEPGEEYWLSMELAGRFASANHRIIHESVAKAAGLSEIASVENHHNFAWRDTIEDATGAARQAIVHRKGATPAGRDVLGVIPGSMGDPGYVVRGRGEPASLASAAHGAGRAMSRRAALQTVPKADRDRYLRERGVTLLGGGIDESPQAYKRIEAVIAAQRDLVDIVGTFTPRIVRMASEPGDI